MDLARLASLVVSNPSLQGVHLNQLLLFFAIASSIKDDLFLIQLSEHVLAVAPAILPPSVEHFITSACNIPLPTVQDCWDAFKDILWHASHSPDAVTVGDIL